MAHYNRAQVPSTLSGGTHGHSCTVFFETYLVCYNKNSTSLNLVAYAKYSKVPY